MSEHYDVIIVGGGYAGLCCGLKLKDTGKRVLILEARKEIARKHRGCQCSLYPFGETFTVDGEDITFHQNNYYRTEDPYGRTVPPGICIR